MQRLLRLMADKHGLGDLPWDMVKSDMQLSYKQPLQYSVSTDFTPKV